MDTHNSRGMVALGTGRETIRDDGCIELTVSASSVRTGLVRWPVIHRTLVTEASSRSRALWDLTSDNPRATMGPFVVAVGFGLLLVDSRKLGTDTAGSLPELAQSRVPAPQEPRP